MKKDIIPIVLKSVHDQCGMGSKVDINDSMEDLGLDMMDLIEIIMDLELELRVEVPDDAEDKIKTVQDIVDYFEQAI